MNIKDQNSATWNAISYTMLQNQGLAIGAKKNSKNQANKNIAQWIVAHKPKKSMAQNIQGQMGMSLSKHMGIIGLTTMAMFMNTSLSQSTSLEENSKKKNAAITSMESKQIIGQKILKSSRQTQRTENSITKTAMALRNGIKNTSQTMTVKATAYCKCSICCNGWADGKTSTGTNANVPGIAVDPKVIPLGSTITLPDGTKLKADDVGGAIKKRRIDIRVTGKNAHRRAFTHKYSQQTITITIEVPE